MATPYASTGEHGAASTEKADVGRRLVAFAIDAAAAGVASLVIGLVSHTLGGIAGAAYVLVRDGLDVDFMYRRSIGKRLMNLGVVRTDGGTMDLETSLRRNWMFALGGLSYASGGFGLASLVSIVGAAIVVYELYRVFTDAAGRRWGDELAHTRVVETTD